MNDCTRESKETCFAALGNVKQNSCDGYFARKSIANFSNTLKKKNLTASTSTSTQK